MSSQRTHRWSTLMDGIAGNVLEQMRQKSLGVSLADRAKVGALSQRVLEARSLDRLGKARHRHHVTAECVLAAEKSDMPTTPSRPTVAVSAVVPSSKTVTNETAPPPRSRFESTARRPRRAPCRAAETRLSGVAGEFNRTSSGNAASSRFLGLKLALPSRANAGRIIFSEGPQRPLPPLGAWATLPSW